MCVGWGRGWDEVWVGWGRGGMRCGQDGVGVMIIGHRYCILYEIHLNILGVWFQSTFKDHPTCVTKSET